MNGPQPLSPADIKNYCDLKGIRRDDEVDLLMDVIGQLDDVWMDDWIRREKARQDAAGKSGGKRH